MAGCPKCVTNGESPGGGGGGRTGRGGGSSDPNNVAACNQFVENVKCGSVGIGQIDCAGYANVTCDISGYFDCLSTKYICRNGQYDSAALATVRECDSKATCN